MREDMAKVIVTRPRVLDSMVRKGRNVPDEHLPKAIGLRRHAHERGGYKMLNETLAPLRRYLERQVGRPWDKVYSEIAQRLRPSSTVQQHVRDHVGDFVNLHRAPAVATAGGWTHRGGSLSTWMRLAFCAAPLIWTGRRVGAPRRGRRRYRRPRRYASPTNSSYAGLPASGTRSAWLPCLRPSTAR
jgi:hypothetical protein